MSIGEMTELRLSGDWRNGLGEKYIPNGSIHSATLSLGIISHKKFIALRLRNPLSGFLFHPDEIVGYSAQRFALYVLIKWWQSALIPFVTTRYVI